MDLLFQKDEKSFEILYDKYSGALYNIILKVTLNEERAQDVLQDSFVKIWKNIETFDVQKGSIFTWMLNICRNTAIDSNRSKLTKQNIHISIDNVNMVSNNSSDININAIGLKNIISKLRPEYYQVLHAVYIQGNTHIEAAKTLDIPVGTLKTRVRNAIVELKQIYSS